VELNVKMVMVTQFMGSTYNTEDYPYILINPIIKKVYGRFSTLQKAHEGRLMHTLNNQDEIVLLYNEKTKKFIDWQKKDNIRFEKYKNNVSKYFDIMRNR